MELTGLIIGAIAGAAAAFFRQEPPKRKIIPDHIDAAIGAVGGIGLAWRIAPYFPAFTLSSYIGFALLCAMSGYVLDDLLSSIAYLTIGSKDKTASIGKKARKRPR